MDLEEENWKTSMLREVPVQGAEVDICHRHGEERSEIHWIYRDEQLHILLDS